MAIPWLIGAAVAAVAVAVLSDSEEEKQEKERERERERRREENRLSREAEKEREQAQARERQQAEAQRQVQIKRFAVQSADALIQKYGLIGVSSEHIANLCMISQEEARKNLQQKYVFSQSAKKLQKEFSDKQQTLSQLDELLKSIEKV